MSIYSTREEAIQREIISALGEFVGSFDVEAIADEVIGSHVPAYGNIGYFCKATPMEFWEATERHALPLPTMLTWATGTQSSA